MELLGPGPVPPTPPSSAEITILTGVTPLTLTLADTFYQLGADWTADLSPINASIDTAAGTITAGIATRIRTDCAISYTSGSATSTLVFQVFKNGSPLPSHLQTTWADTVTFPNSITIVGLDDVAPGDVLDVRVKCTTGAGLVLLVTFANFSVAN